jgi:cytochrome c oxidase cbb3-type subunit 3
LSTDDETTPPPEPPFGIDPAASRWIFFGMLALLSGALLAYNLLGPSVSPPPAAIAGDPLLVEGRTIYRARCLGCHGERGRGDGAIAKSLAGPPVGDLTDADWKHGEAPEQVIGVIAQGAKGTAMPAWNSVLDPPQLRAVAAYVYYLAGREVPAPLRIP